MLVRATENRIAGAQDQVTLNFSSTFFESISHRAEIGGYLYLSSVEICHELYIHCRHNGSLLACVRKFYLMFDVCSVRTPVCPASVY